jgi:hypothetical protein
VTRTKVCIAALVAAASASAMARVARAEERLGLGDLPALPEGTASAGAKETNETELAAGGGHTQTHGARSAPVEQGDNADDLPMTFRASKPATDEPPVAPRTTRPTTMEEVSEASLQEIHIGGSKARYTLNFFGDTSFSFGDPQAPSDAAPIGRFPSFSLGVQDFLLRGEVGKHFVAITEFAFEIGDGVVVDVERLHVRWQMDSFFVEAGRVHTSFGYWNNAYHHGRWLQPTIERPRWVAFEDNDGLLPVHWVGIDVGAKIKAGAGTLNLVASLGNGRGKIVDDVRNAGDYQSGKAVHGAIEYVGLIWPDLRLGVSTIYGRIPAQPVLNRPALPDVPINEWIGGGYVAYASVPLLLITEGYVVDHRHADQNWTTYGGFALLGYTIGPVTPYVEFERIVAVGGQDPFFVPDPSQPSPSFDTAATTLGLRLDLSDWTALKAEYRNTQALDRDSVVHEGVLNWSWGF